MSLYLRGALSALAFSALAAGANANPCSTWQERPSILMPGEPLTLIAAFTEIRRASPAARAAGLEARALSADADQAGRRLNPSLSLGLDNFSGSGPLSGFDQTESTFAIEQTFRLGGKRMLGERAARARQALASAECEVILRETELEAAVLFAELVAASKLQDLALESADLADELASTVERRVDAGAAAPPELARARADAAALRASVATAEANVDQLRYALSLLWGSADPTFTPPRSDMTSKNSAAETSELSHPALDAADAALRTRQAEHDLARSAAVPDITVSAGLRRFEETGDQAFVAGVSVPLPLFDRGRDAARAASLRGDIASLNRAATEQRLLARQRAAVASRRAAQTRLDILTNEALPAAEEAYSAAVRGYEIGRFDLTTTLDARAALLEAGSALIEADFALQSEDMRLRALIGATPFDGEIR
jgi:outer membrane protein, heavy metal efflux system